MRLTTILLVLLATRVSSDAAVYYVDDDAAGGTGSSWQTAFSQLEDALAQSTNGDEIRVAGGVYRPAGPGGDRETSFLLANGVRVLGGYAGLSQPGSPDDRDPTTFVTVLSGDLNGDDTPGFGNRVDNSYHVVYAQHLHDPETLLDGVTVSGGSATAGACCFYNRGGGYYSLDSLGTINNVIFTDNQAVGPGAGEGGAMYIVTDSDISISNCRFEGNYSGKQGGAIFIRLTANVQITDTVFAHNTAGGGGAICNFVSGFSATDCVFLHNTAQLGGAIQALGGLGELLQRCAFIENTAASDGGAIRLASEQMTLSECSFTDNSAPFFGSAINNYGISGDSSLLILNSVFEGHDGVAVHTRDFNSLVDNSTEIRGSVFRNNGVCVEGYGGTTTTIGESTFVGNSGGATSGVIPSDVLFLDNCLIWNNGNGSEVGQLGVGGTYQVNYCLVQGWTGHLGGVGNFAEDPVFLGDGIHLSQSSPAIDRGDPAFQSLSTLGDIDGQDRILGGRVDVGADEVRPASTQSFIRGDCNIDGSFDLADAVLMLGFLFGSGSPGQAGFGLVTCTTACDTNDDDENDIGDAVFTLSALFSGGSQPPSPHPQCGVDPTVSNLTCDEFEVCP